MEEHKFTEEDFTEGRLRLLRMGFNVLDTIVENCQEDNSDVHLRNELYDLKEKLGIYDIL